MNPQLLKSSIENIKQLREELHNDIDSSKRNKLDQIIKDLESYEGQKVSVNQILSLFGKALAIFSVIERVLNKLDN